MALEDYYEQFFIQELAEIPPENPDFTSSKLYEYQDGKEIMGLFKQKQSGELPLAGSDGTYTIGRFATGADITSGSILRRVRDDVFIKIVGDTLESPKQALTQVKTWESYITSRNEEMKERYIRGSYK